MTDTGGDMATLRVSDADRNGTMRRLHNAVALGLIDIDEFEERSALVSQARMHSDLDALVFDLPRAWRDRDVGHRSGGTARGARLT